MKLAIAKLFGSLQPNNLCVAVDESASFFERLFPSRVAGLIAEGDQSHDEDRTSAIELPIPREAGNRMPSLKTAALALLRQLVVDHSRIGGELRRSGRRGRIGFAERLFHLIQRFALGHQLLDFLVPGLHLRESL